MNGIKQLSEDPFNSFANLNEKGTIVKGVIKEVSAKAATVELAEDVLATLKASEISIDRVEDASNVLKEGEEVEARIISIDRKNRNISLSIKAKDQAEEKAAMKELRTKTETTSSDTTAGPTTIGDLIKAQMEGK